MSHTSSATIVAQADCIAEVIEKQILLIEESKRSANKEIGTIDRLKSIVMANMIGRSEELQQEAQRVFTVVDAIVDETRKTVADIDRKVVKARQRLDKYHSIIA